MAQTSYASDLSRAYAGLVADGGLKEIKSGIHAGLQVSVITFAGATDATTYTVTINGTAYDTAYADASPTAEELQDAVDTTLAAAVTAGDISGTIQVTSTTLYIIGVADADMAIQLSDNNSASADWSVADRIGFEGDMPFGVFVCMDDSNGAGYARLPYLSADIGLPTLGVVAQVTAQEPNGGNGYSFENVLPICSKGRVWCLAEETLSAGDDVYVRFIPNGAGKLQLGAIRNDSDSSTCAQLTNAFVRDYKLVGSDKLALIQFN